MHLTFATSHLDTFGVLVRRSRMAFADPKMHRGGRQQGSKGQNLPRLCHHRDKVSQDERHETGPGNVAVLQHRSLDKTEKARRPNRVGERCSAICSCPGRLGQRHSVSVPMRRCEASRCVVGLDDPRVKRAKIFVLPCGSRAPDSDTFCCFHRATRKVRTDFLRKPSCMCPRNSCNCLLNSCTCPPNSCMCPPSSCTCSPNSCTCPRNSCTSVTRRVVAQRGHLFLRNSVGDMKIGLV